MHNNAQMMITDCDITFFMTYNLLYVKAKKRTDSLASLNMDYMSQYPEQQYDLIMSNPSFFLASNIIVASLKDCRQDGFIVVFLRLLLRITTVEAVLKKNMPVRVFAHSKRTRFQNIKQNDLAEYARFN